MIWILSIGPLCASELDYPQQQNLTALQIAKQVELVLRARLPKNALSKKTNGKMSRLINRRLGRKASVNQFESYINNDYQNGNIKQKQLVIFRSGKLKGTGILITQFQDDKLSPLMQIWLPKLRKVRRFAAPEADELWNGSNLSYGEIFLRKLNDETHSIEAKIEFEDCLNTLVLTNEELSKHSKNLPEPQCEHKGKKIYRLKSITVLPNKWYDYRISYVDTASFATYRTQYFKNNALIKVIDIDWQSLKQADPRSIYPAYLYSKSHINKSESLMIVPRETVFWDAKIKDKFWSESSLRRIRR